MIFTITACGNKSDNEISQQNQPSAAIDDASDSIIAALLITSGIPLRNKAIKEYRRRNNKDHDD